ncbi:O-antigen ligase family protein [Lutibacter sp. TH_r2]|uniref:O-antigen ligase family protein n=1 Tax=Lutibacter sp. TH_r2 TaxID=3082083 RepID=UPI002952F35B|nr:O-antigen ligase family protein [Lutibacter sp. TH_r2]MDV7187797.1 O-antigen ligase family protein [Lutibacter sp. TH_r2]
MNRIIYLVTFFIYSGYYAFLAIVFALGMTNSSRWVTIPLRMVTTFLMLYVILRIVSKVKLDYYKKWILIVFCSFWLFYVLKVLLNQNVNVPLSRNWYEYIFYALNFSILPFIMFMLIDFKKYSKTILNSLIFSGFVMGLVTLILYRKILSNGVGRINLAKYADFEPQTLNPLALSYAGSLTIVLCLYVLLYKKPTSQKYRLYIYSTIILAAIMFFLGASRGSVIALILSVPVLFYFGNIKKKSRFIFITIISIPLLIWGALETGSSVFERTLKTTQGYRISARQELWSEAWYEFLAHPIFGGRIEIGVYPHNFILETLMATGVVGFILLLMVLIPSFKRAFKLSNLDHNYIWVFIVLIQGFVQHSFTAAIYFSVLLFFPMGLLFSYSKNIRQ